MKARSATLGTTVVMMLGVMSAAQAHVEFANNTATGGRSFVATANISHGCTIGIDHYDTYKVVVELPTVITLSDGTTQPINLTARPVHSTIGPASVDVNNSNLLIWEKAMSDAEAHDSHFYQVEFRFTVPVPVNPLGLGTLGFKTTQYCTDGVSEVGTLVWEGPEIPTIKVVPARTPGWNKYTAQTDIDADSIAAFFPDAQIVWSNGQAYSSNPVIAGLINNPLTIIPTGTEYWVKY